MNLLIEMLEELEQLAYASSDNELKKRVSTYRKRVTPKPHKQRELVEVHGRTITGVMTGVRRIQNSAWRKNIAKID